MQKTLTLIFCSLLVAGLAGAAVLPCSTYASNNGTPTSPGTEVNYIAAQGGCTIGGLLFTGFTYSGSIQGSSTSTSTGQDFTLDRATISNNIVDLGFNPGGVFVGGGDVHFTFTVTGGVTGADLTDLVGGTSINEVNCQKAPGLVGPNNGNCDNAADGLLWTTNLSGPGSAPPGGGEFFYTQGAQNLVYVWKDINAGTVDLSQFDETFGIPEPTTMLLLGAGLAGLGVLRFRRKKS